MSSSKYDQYCLTPPHPELLARVQAQRMQLQQNVGTSTSDAVPPLSALLKFPEPLFEPSPEELRVRSMVFERGLLAALRGAIRLAIVLVDFSDKAMGSNTSQRINDLFFSRGVLSTGSVTEYYAEVSNNKVSLAGQVVGPFRMPRKLSDYANNRYGRGTATPNVKTLAADALALATGNINFKTFDNDGNGYVDAFIVVHAGTGAEQSGNVNDIWSLRSYLPNATAVNGVNVYGFLTIPEDANIGVCAHELGHLLFEWPDLYDIDFAGDVNNVGIVSQGAGAWCLMSGGNWGSLPGNAQGTTPCHPSAWCKRNQGWVDTVIETGNRSLALADVKLVPSIRRLWSYGDGNSKEYFLVENRQQTGFDRSLPGSGLLIWHIDDNLHDNRNEKHYWVGLEQADGLNQLATAAAGRGDDGDPFPGSSHNISFTRNSNPNSRAYNGQDSYVEITNISPPDRYMTMMLTVTPFIAIYSQGEPGSGIGGYNLNSRADLAFSFDYDSSGKMDHIVLYRPGTGTCWILGNNDGVWSPKFREGDPGRGIGGYNLNSPADRAFAFDYDSSGKLDHLVFYRPGKGAVFIIKRSPNGFTAVYAQGDPGRGIGGYNLNSPADRAFAFDYNHSGKQDHLCFYRPGTGTMWILRNNGGNFVAVYRQGDPGNGIGGFNLNSPADRAFAFDWESSGKMDHIALYRPGTGTFWCLRNDQGNFHPVISVGAPGNGIGGYNLNSPADVAFAYDWDGSGKQDHIALYRPGTGTFWCLRNDRGVLQPVISEGDPGRGIGRYNLNSPDDKIFPLDYDHSGRLDHLVMYRTNGTGTIWILKRPTLTDRWMSIGGIFKPGSPVAAVSRFPTLMDVFIVGMDGRVYTSWWNRSASWSGMKDNWLSLGGFFPPNANVTAVSRSPDNLDLFICGNDGRVYTSWWVNGSQWSGVGNNWRAIGGFFPPGAKIAAVARTKNNLDLFVCGNDGRVYTSWWVNGSDWSGINNNWLSIGGFFPPGAKVSAVSRTKDNLDLFIGGNDGQVYTSWWTLSAGAWSGINNNWLSLGGAFAAGIPVTALARTSNNLDLFVCGSDGRIWTSWWDGHEWVSIRERTWVRLGGVFKPGTEVAAVSRSPDNLDLFICGSDGQAYTSWWTGSAGWSGHRDNWRPMGGSFPPGTAMSAIARSQSGYDVFACGLDSRVSALSQFPI